MKCPECGSTNSAKNGTKKGVQNYYCRDCGKFFKGGDSDSPNQKAPFKSSKSKNKKMGGISVEQFRKSYDVVFILSQVHEKFENGLLYEKSDVIKMAGLTSNFKGVTTELESAEWKQYKGRVNQKDWYAKPELIKKLKDEGILS